MSDTVEQSLEKLHEGAKFLHDVATGPASGPDSTVTNPVDQTQQPTAAKAVADLPANSLQKDANGDLIMSDLTSIPAAPFDSPGNIYFSGHTGVTWTQPDGTTFGAGIQHDTDKNTEGGELVVNSAWRIAAIPQGPFQVFGDESSRNGSYLHITSGASTASDTLKNSRAVSLQTSVWDGSADRSSAMMLQAHPLDAVNGHDSELRFYDKATVIGSDSSTSTPDSGKVQGDQIGTLRKEGLWTPGTAPTFETLTDGATIQLSASRYKTHQNHKVTLSGDRELNITGLENGMRGTIYVAQDSTGGRTLTLPAGSAIPSGFALSSGANMIDRLTWETDGVTIYWDITNDLTLSLDVAAAAYLTAIGNSDPAIDVAVNSFVLGLKSAGIWDGFKGIYPFIGGDAAKHAINLRQTGNMTFGGGVIHNANGITGNATSAYGASPYSPDDMTSNDSLYLYSYCRTEAPTVGSDLMGAESSNRCQLTINTSTRMSVRGFHNPLSSGIFVDHSGDFRGHCLGSRTGPSAQFARCAGVTVVDSDAWSGGVSANIHVLSNGYNGNPENFTNANLGLSAMGDGLTEAQSTTFENLVDGLMTALGRNV